MESISIILSTATGYILRAVCQSKTAETAKEQLLNNFWKWIRPSFIKDIPQIEEKSTDPELEDIVYETLVKLIRNESFYQELVQRLTDLKQAGLTEKNIVVKNIQKVKKVRIGDKKISPNDSYNRKNIVEGSVKEVDDFLLGDGH